MTLEKEIKFISSANTQIKFYNRNLHADIFQKLEKLLLALGIEIEHKSSTISEKAATRLDTYFDDDWHLADGGCSLTVRSYFEQDAGEKMSDILILKSNEKTGRTNGIEFLTRRQFRTKLDEGVKDRFAKTGLSVAEIKQYFPEAELPVDEHTLFKKEGETHIRRAHYLILVDKKRYRLSVDRYYFFNCELNKYSETFIEIEIESRSETNDFDRKIKQLAEILEAMLEIEIEPVSKYQRFKEFSVSSEFEERYFVGFDLVAYSTGPAWTQKQIVQRFHKIIKDQVTRAGLVKKKEPIKISIGDGAVIAAKDVDWINIARLLNRISSAVTKNNAGDPLRRIEYRTAVHYGPVFRFTDLNDMINVAGHGINIVNRVLGEAGGGQVVLSRDAYLRAVDEAPTGAGQFQPLGEREVKHGLKVELYQFIDA